MTQLLATPAHSQLTEMTDRARYLARDISKNIGRILAALQIGDISRQRAEHVKAGLTLLDGLDRSASDLRLRAAGEMLLAAQLEAALRDYNQAVSKLPPSIEGLASDALALAALSDIVTDLVDSGDGLRDLKRRMDAAVQIFAEIQAADGAMRYLAGRLANDKGAIVATGAHPLTSERHPLDQKACDFLDRVVYLEAAADDCVVILERLKEASEALIADHEATGQTSDIAPETQTESQKGLAGAADRLKAILNKAEDDIAVHAGKNTDILRLLDRAATPTISQGSFGDLEVEAYTGLNFISPDLGLDDGAFRGDLNALLSKIDGLYAMGQERDVHRAFSKACGLEVAEDPAEIEDGLF
jgi:hypothetical protein